LTISKSFLYHHHLHIPQSHLIAITFHYYNIQHIHLTSFTSNFFTTYTMGLIKTAIMTGGGIYAVNKLAKASEARHQNSQQSYSRDQSYSPQSQGYHHGPSSPPQTREVYAEREQRGEGYWVAAPPLDSRERDVYEREKWEREEAWRRHQEEMGNSPPQYAQRSQENIPQGQLMSGHGNGSNTSLGAMAGLAMDFVGNQDNGKKGKSEVLGKLFK
jgi:hypothetical protein